MRAAKMSERRRSAVALSSRAHAFSVEALIGSNKKRKLRDWEEKGLDLSMEALSPAGPLGDTEDAAAHGLEPHPGECAGPDRGRRAERGFSWKRRGTTGESVLGPEWRKELATLLGQSPLHPAPTTCFSVISSLSQGASDPRQPGLIAPLLSPGPSSSKGAEELSPLPAEATGGQVGPWQGMAVWGWGCSAGSCLLFQWAPSLPSPSQVSLSPL